MATVIADTFADILTKFKAQILAYTNLLTDQVFISQDDDPPNTMGGPIVLITAGSERPNIPIGSGGGRLDPRVRRQLIIRLRTRLELDEVDRSVIWMQDTTLGHLALEDQLINALMTEFLVDSSSNGLLWEPMTWQGITRPEKPNRSTGTDWGRSDIYFDIPYTRIISVSKAPYPYSDFALTIVDQNGNTIVDQNGNIFVNEDIL